MLTFHSLHDLNKLDSNDPARLLIADRIKDLNGYIILIEEGDTHIELPELRKRLIDISWEGVFRVDSHYIGIYLTNNEFTLEFLIPESVDGDLIECLKDHATD